MNQPIDNLLRDWSARREPGESERRQLEARVLQAARQAIHDGRQSRAKPAGRQSLRQAHHLLWFAAGIAATLLIAGIWLFLARTRDPLAPLLSEESGLFAGRRGSMARIFRETEQLFGSNLQWVAQSGGDAELGITETPAEGEALVVRVVVVARPVGTAAWKRLWKADVVARANGILEISPDGNPDNRMALWLHRLEGGAALVESRLTLHAPVAIEAETSEVLKFGATRKVTRVLHGGVEYLLLQTVAPVAGGQPCAS